MGAWFEAQVTKVTASATPPAEDDSPSSSNRNHRLHSTTMSSLMSECVCVCVCVHVCVCVCVCVSVSVHMCVCLWIYIVHVYTCIIMRHFIRYLKVMQMMSQLNLPLLTYGHGQGTATSGARSAITSYPSLTLYGIYSALHHPNSSTWARW